MFSNLLRLLVVGFLLVAVWGCATGPEIQAKRDHLRETTPTCSTERECKEMWSAAQAWVASNCGMKLQTVTDTIIQTYNPPGSSPALAAQIIKEPLGGGKYRILIKAYCSNIFGCVPDQWESAFKFNDYVGTFKER